MVCPSETTQCPSASGGHPFVEQTYWASSGYQAQFQVPRTQGRAEAVMPGGAHSAVKGTVPQTPQVGGLNTELPNLGGEGRRAVLTCWGLGNTKKAFCSRILPRALNTASEIPPPECPALRLLPSRSSSPSSPQEGGRAPSGRRTEDQAPSLGLNFPLCKVEELRQASGAPNLTLPRWELGRV